MATYRRETRIEAPFEEVWTFHSTTDGLEALTPEFMNLEVGGVTGPDGDPDPDELDAGARIELDSTLRRRSETADDFGHHRTNAR